MGGGSIWLHKTASAVQMAALEGASEYADSLNFVIIIVGLRGHASRGILP